MWDDPIVQEIRKVREDHAARFNFDIQAIVADLKKQQEDGGAIYLTLPSKKPTILPKSKINKDVK